MSDLDLALTHGRDAEWARSIARLETMVAIAGRVRRNATPPIASEAVRVGRMIVDSGTDTIAKFARLV